VGVESILGRNVDQGNYVRSVNVIVEFDEDLKAF